jgi:hypothetical protein
MPVESKRKPPIIDRLKTNLETIRTLDDDDSLFHNLPADLRNMVFEYLCISTPIIYTEFAGMQLTLYRHDTVPQHSVPLQGLPVWLQACRIFLLEGRVMISKRFNFAVGPHVSSANNNWNDINLQVVIPFIRNTLAIRTGSLDVVYNATGASFQPDRVGLGTIRHALRYLKFEQTSTSGQLRCLRLQVAFVNVCFICQWQTRATASGSDPNAAIWGLDLSYLEQFGLRLDVFELEVRNVDTKVAEDSLSHVSSNWPDVEPLFEEEVRRVGEALTGNCYGASSCYLRYSGQQHTVIFRYERSESA